MMRLQLWSSCIYFVSFRVRYQVMSPLLGLTENLRGEKVRIDALLGDYFEHALSKPFEMAKSI